MDDFRDTTDSTAELVGLWGHDVRRAYSGAAALELAAEYGPTSCSWTSECRAWTGTRWPDASA